MMGIETITPERRGRMILAMNLPSAMTGFVRAVVDHVLNDLGIEVVEPKKKVQVAKLHPTNAKFWDCPKCERRHFDDVNHIWIAGDNVECPDCSEPITLA